MYATPAGSERYILFWGTSRGEGPLFLEATWKLPIFWNLGEATPQKKYIIATEGMHVSVSYNKFIDYHRHCIENNGFVFEYPRDGEARLTYVLNCQTRSIPLSSVSEQHR